MKRAAIIIGIISLLSFIAPARAGVVWYVNDYAGWAAAAGDVRTIDFDTLPNGLPSVAGTLITPEFNYTSQGVTFLGHATTPFITGNDVTGFGLEVDTSPGIERDWITAELVTSARAVGTHYAAYEVLSIYDEDGELIGSRDLVGSGILFLGVISDVPISTAMLDRDSSYHGITSFYSAVVPEPTTALLVASSALMLITRRRRGHGFSGNGNMSQRNGRFHGVGLFFVVAALAANGGETRAGVVWYVNDYAGWAAAAGDVHTIDFETLPDGTPSVAETLITPEFNYATQGVIFSAGVNSPFIVGNPWSGFQLRADSYPGPALNWIVADLVQPVRAIGVVSVVHSDLAIYDPTGRLISSESIHGPGGETIFLGVVSDDPILRAIADQDWTAHVIGGFDFAPIPEPTGLIFFAVSYASLVWRRVRTRPI